MVCYYGSSDQLSYFLAMLKSEHRHTGRAFKRLQNFMVVDQSCLML